MLKSKLTINIQHLSWATDAIYIYLLYYENVPIVVFIFVMKYIKHYMHFYQYSLV